MGSRAIDFHQAHRQLNEFFEHCKHKMQQARDDALVKDEKPLLKDEKLFVKDEKEAQDASAPLQSTQVSPVHVMCL